jgi:hypothetical protein
VHCAKALTVKGWGIVYERACWPSDFHHAHVQARMLTHSYEHVHVEACHGATSGSQALQKSSSRYNPEHIGTQPAVPPHTAQHSTTRHHAAGVAEKVKPQPITAFYSLGQPLARAVAPLARASCTLADP